MDLVHVPTVRTYSRQRLTREPAAVSRSCRYGILADVVRIPTVEDAVPVMLGALDNLFQRPLRSSLWIGVVGTGGNVESPIIPNPCRVLAARTPSASQEFASRALYWCHP